MSIQETFTQSVTCEQIERRKLARPLTPAIAAILERHISRHGYKCVVDTYEVVIILTRYDSEFVKIGEVTLPVRTIVEAYKAMGL